MRFGFIDAERAKVSDMPMFPPVQTAAGQRLRLLRLAQSTGPSQRQLDDMVLLAHVRAAFRLQPRNDIRAELVHHEPSPRMGSSSHAIERLG